MLEIRKYYSDWECIEIGIGIDHIHLHVIIPSKYSVSMAVEKTKKNTASILNKSFLFSKKSTGTKKEFGILDTLFLL